jgi:UDP-N-acetylglucosamine--N-acetylmuramyl-(pentapeptide) pyrophosphoryl-undecaprenol N-acetylglucosamine transferase
MVKEGYIQFEYLDQELKDAYAAADLILSRAGASALSEFSSLKKKSVLVPLDYNQSRGEQILNATKYAESNPAEVILEKDLNLQSFETAVKKLETNSKLNLKDTNESRQSVVSELLFSIIPTKRNKL